MRRLLLVLALMMGFGAQAQTLGEPSRNASEGWTAKLNPLSVLMLTLNGAVEYALGDNMSVQGGAFLGGVPQAVSPSNNTLRWWGLTGEWRFYPQGRGMDGYYLAPYLRYRRVRSRFNGAAYDPDVQANRTAEIKERINDFGGGALLGRQWVFESAVSLDLFAGPMFTRASNRPSITCESCDGDEQMVESVVPVELGGLGIRAGLTLGFHRNP